MFKRILQYPISNKVKFTYLAANQKLLSMPKGRKIQVVIRRKK